MAFELIPTTKKELVKLEGKIKKVKMLELRIGNSLIGWILPDHIEDTQQEIHWLLTDQSRNTKIQFIAWASQQPEFITITKNQMSDKFTAEFVADLDRKCLLTSNELKQFFGLR